MGRVTHTVTGKSKQEILVGKRGALQQNQIKIPVKKPDSCSEATQGKTQEKSSVSSPWK